MNNNIINLKIYSIDKVFLEKTIKKLIMNGKEGTYTILPKHIDYISSFEIGFLSYVDLDDKKYFIALSHGVLVKTGREVQITTFEAIGNEESLSILENVILKKIEENSFQKESEKNIKISLQNIEKKLFEEITKDTKKYERKNIKSY